MYLLSGEYCILTCASVVHFSLSHNDEFVVLSHRASPPLFTNPLGILASFSFVHGNLACCLRGVCPDMKNKTSWRWKKKTF